MEYKATFSSFSVNNVEAAKKFYSETLGIIVDDEMGGLKLTLNGGARVYIYQRDDHVPAIFTVLNFVVQDINTTIEQLRTNGIKMEQYNHLPAPQDETGVLRGKSAGMGPDIAWFKDPSGNVLSIVEE